MNDSKASHRKQFRFYDEDIELIERLRRVGESDASVIRRCLKQTAVMAQKEGQQVLPLYRQTLCSYDPTGHELLFEGSFEQFYSQEHLSVQVQAQAAQELAQTNGQRLKVIEQLLSEPLDE